MALITHERAEMAVPLQGLDPDYLQYLILAASQWAESICGRFFEKKSRTQIVSGDRESSLWLKATPIESITSIDVKDSYGEIESYLPEEFVFDAELGEVKWSPESEEIGYFLPGFKNVTVVYVGGFDPIPFDLQAAVIGLAIKVKETDSSASGIKFEKMGEYAVSYGGSREGLFGVPSNIMNVLALYMRR